MAESITLANAHYPFSLRPLYRDVARPHIEKTETSKLEKTPKDACDIFFNSLKNNEKVIDICTKATEYFILSSMEEYPNPFDDNDIPYCTSVTKVINPLKYPIDNTSEHTDLQFIKDALRKISPGEVFEDKGILSKLVKDLETDLKKLQKQLEDMSASRHPSAQEGILICLESFRNMFQAAFEGDKKTVERLKQELQTKLTGEDSSLAPFVASLLGDREGSSSQKLMWALAHFLSKDNENFLNFNSVSEQLKKSDNKMLVSEEVQEKLRELQVILTHKDGALPTDVEEKLKDIQQLYQKRDLKLPKSMKEKLDKIHRMLQKKEPELSTELKEEINQWVKNFSSKLEKHFPLLKAKSLEKEFLKLKQEKVIQELKKEITFDLFDASIDEQSYKHALLAFGFTSEEIYPESSSHSEKKCRTSYI